MPTGNKRKSPRSYDENRGDLQSQYVCADNLYVLYDVCWEAVEVAADIRQSIGIHTIRARVDRFLYVLIGRQINFGLSVFEYLLNFFLLEAYHVLCFLAA